MASTLTGDAEWAQIGTLWGERLWQSAAVPRRGSAGGRTPGRYIFEHAHAVEGSWAGPGSNPLGLSPHWLDYLASALDE